MRNFWLAWRLVLGLAGCAGGLPAKEPRHYVFFGQDRERIAETSFLETKAFEGAQLKYTWRELEPEKDGYDFRAIEQDLRFLGAHGRRLFVQLQDVTFAPGFTNVPRYLTRDPRYHGGVAAQYDIPGDDESRAVAAGWVARRWDPAVRERFHRLLAALGATFDGRIEGINLAETAVDFGASGRLYPAGFTPAAYRDAVLANLAALKRSFVKSVTMQYANFMPGEWLPDDDRGYLRSLYAEARRLKVGVGGPDLLPGKPGQLNHSYPLIRASAGIVPTGIAVQEGNYAHANPKTGRSETIPGLIAFAAGELKVDYLFWGAEEPFYTDKLIPFLRTRSEAGSSGAERRTQTPLAGESNLETGQTAPRDPGRRPPPAKAGRE